MNIGTPLNIITGSAGSSMPAVLLSGSTLAQNAQVFLQLPGCSSLIEYRYIGSILIPVAPLTNNVVQIPICAITGSGEFQSVGFDNTPVSVQINDCNSCSNSSNCNGCNSCSNENCCLSGSIFGIPTNDITSLCTDSDIIVTDGSCGCAGLYIDGCKLVDKGIIISDGSIKIEKASLSTYNNCSVKLSTNDKFHLSANGAIEEVFCKTYAPNGEYTGRKLCLELEGIDATWLTSTSDPCLTCNTGCKKLKLSTKTAAAAKSFKYNCIGSLDPAKTVKNPTGSINYNYNCNQFNNTFSQSNSSLGVDENGNPIYDTININLSKNYATGIGPATNNTATADASGYIATTDKFKITGGKLDIDPTKLCLIGDVKVFTHSDTTVFFTDPTTAPYGPANVGVTSHPSRFRKITFGTFGAPCTISPDLIGYKWVAKVTVHAKVDMLQVGSVQPTSYYHKLSIYPSLNGSAVGISLFDGQGTQEIDVNRDPDTDINTLTTLFDITDSTISTANTVEAWLEWRTQNTNPCTPGTRESAAIFGEITASIELVLRKI